MSGSGSGSGDGDHAGHAGHGHGHGHEGYVGGVGEEAARLLEAVQDWARRTAGSSDPGPPDGAEDADGAARPGSVGNPAWTGRIGTDALECQLCPLCRLIAVVRHTRPEVVEHLADATSSLAAALRDLLAATQHERTRPGAVERIDIG